MFGSHNIFTKLSYWLLALSSLSGFIFMGMIFPSLVDEQPTLVYALVVILSLMLILNTYFAYRIYHKSISALKLCLWLYGLQVIGFETENWALSLTFGMKFTISWSYETTNITINLLAIAIWFVVFKALRSVSLANKLIE
jgi:hypothetical protein